MEQLLRYALKNDTIACMSILKKCYIPNKLSPDLFTDEMMIIISKEVYK